MVRGWEPGACVGRAKRRQVNTYGVVKKVVVKDVVKVVVVCYCFWLFVVVCGCMMMRLSGYGGVEELDRWVEDACDKARRGEVSIMSDCIDREKVLKYYARTLKKNQGSGEAYVLRVLYGQERRIFHEHLVIAGLSAIIMKGHDSMCL